MQVKDIIALFKVRLSLTVVFSSMMTYFIAILIKDLAFDLSCFLSLSIGGALITFAANAFNQILEKEQDGIMKRTQNRPLVQNKLSLSEAFFIATITGIIGFITLYFGTFPIVGVFGLASLILYAFVYTPSKRFTSFCVFIGAIPGALPPLIGYMAGTGEIDSIGIYLFVFQFIWQFPHFWAIAWMLDEDYKKVEYKMLPSKTGKSKISALIILIYTIFTVIIGAVPYTAHIMNIWGLIVVTIAGVYFVYMSFLLLQKMNDTQAKKLMFASLIYMPIVYLMILFSNLL
ncbi:heme o synthase [Bacteroidia bacterium]|nr:heme o synthase [Bacteroidia bacterium]